MLWRLDLATCWRLTSVAKNACLAKIGAVFKFFQFSLELLWLFIFSLNYLLPKHSVCPFSNSIVASFLLKIIKKRYGSSLPHFICYGLCVTFLLFGLLFLSYCVQLFYSLCAGYGGLCLMLISSGIVLLVTMFLFFVLCFGCCWFSNSFDKWVWHFL